MKNFLLIVLIALAIPARAQEVVRCATDRIIEQKLKENPALQERLDLFRQKAQEWAKAEQNSPRKTAQVYSIPVVVHVVYNSAAENISDAQIHSQIDVLNRDFRRLNSDTSNTPSVFKPVAGDAEIEFCLAKTDPNGGFTSGITRTLTTKTSFSESNDDIKYSSSGGVNGWPSGQYLNIWVGNISGSILGYSSVPFFSPASADGVVINYKYFGTTSNVAPPYNGGRTTTHEIGHWLGLLHTWGLSTGCSDDDQVSDTPLQDDAHYNCPSFPQSSCGSQDMFMNFMDYVNDGCMNLFTAGQITRMRGILGNYRSSILSSTKCTYTSPYNLDAQLLEIIVPGNTMCANRFNPITILRNNGNNVLTSVRFSVKVDGAEISSYIWTGSLAFNETDTVYLPSVMLNNGSYIFNISVSEPNEGLDQAAHNDAAGKSLTVSSTGTASGLPYGEGFEGTSFPPADWTINNPDGDKAWVQSTAAGGDSLSSKSMFFDNHSNLPNPKGKRDEAISPPISFEIAGGATLTFKIAHAPYTAIIMDTLRVYATNDCGQTWILLYEKWGAALGTAPMQLAFFTPKASQWRKESILINGLAGSGKVQFKFENASGGGNNIYIDDINIEYGLVGIEDKDKSKLLHIYPNPANELLTVELPDNDVALSWKLTNIMGQEVLRQASTESSNKIMLNLAGLAQGIYFVEVKSGEGAYSGKIYKSR